MGMSHLNGPCASTDHPGSLPNSPCFAVPSKGESWEAMEQPSGRLSAQGPLSSNPGGCLEKIARPCRPPGASLRPETGAAARKLCAQPRGGESSMPMKKTIGAIVAGFVLLFAGRYLLHSVLLKSAYMQSSDVWRTPEAMMHRMWAAQLANFIFAVAAVLIYVRGIEQKPWLGQGIRFGVLLALATAVPQSLIEYFVYPIHHELALHWIIGEGGLAVLLGVLIAAICQPKPAGA